MIYLSKLHGEQVVVNDDHILFAESTPDTVLTLTTGAILIVKEPLDVVIERAAEYRRRIHAQIQVRAQEAAPGSEGPNNG